MSGDARTALEFVQSWLYLKAQFPTGDENDFVRIWYNDRNPINERWWIYIQYKGVEYRQGQPTVYAALDAANDWWFHAQRGMLDVPLD